MTALQGSYITVAEADALVEHLLASTDPRRTAWSAASDADKAIHLRAAAADLDACAFAGRPEDDEQGLAFPRERTDGTEILGRTGTAALVDGVLEWSRADIPLEVRGAAALHAARRACRALALDDDDAIDADARRGVSARSGGSGSIAIDLARAGSPRARIDPDAYAAIAHLLAAGGNVA